MEDNRSIFDANMISDRLGRGCTAYWYGGMESEPRWARGLAANCPPHLVYLVGLDLLRRSGTFGLCWYMPAYGKHVHCFLFCESPFDSMWELVENYGGTRRAAATCASFYVPFKVLRKWLNEKF